MLPTRTHDQPEGSQAYRGHAGRYDRRTERFQHWRELFIDNLAVTRGDTVLDIGFGTGLYLPLHREKVGPTGTIIGVDASRQMLQIAAAERTHFVIILGIILLILGFVLTIPILWTIGIILIVAGVVLGATGRAVGGRKYWY